MITEEMVYQRLAKLFQDDPDTWDGFDDHLKNVHMTAAYNMLRREEQWISGGAP